MKKTETDDQKKTHELEQRLAIAEEWIRRSISGVKLSNMKNVAIKKTSQNLSETEDEIMARMEKYFWESFPALSHENREILLESELSFSHIVRQKNLDCLIVSNSYQKILEDIFEENLTKKFRIMYAKTRLHPEKNDVLAKTLYKVIKSSYKLSLWKVFLILQQCFSEKRSDLVELFREAIVDTPLFMALNDGNFWEFFSDIIETGAFWEKRHSGKISLQDVRFLREKIVWNFEHLWLLKLILQYIL